MLDGCALNGKIWVFAAGTTDVGWTLTVTDQATGASKVYRNELGLPSSTGDRHRRASTATERPGRINSARR